MRFQYFLGVMPFAALAAASACVGDSSIITSDAAPDNSIVETGSDVTTNDAPADAPAETKPPLCGAPGEDCCTAPLAPCNDGLTCSTASPKKCLVSDAWAVGAYSTLTSTQFVTELVTAHY